MVALGVAVQRFEDAAGSRSPPEKSELLWRPDGQLAEQQGIGEPEDCGGAADSEPEEMMATSATAGERRIILRP